MTILRADERKQLQLGLNAVVGLAYTEYPDLWPDIFTESPSEKAYEEDELHRLLLVLISQTGLLASLVEFPLSRVSWGLIP